MTEPTPDLLRRRPVKAREWKPAGQAARFLTRKGVTPNQISLAGIGFAALAALMMVVTNFTGPVVSGILFIFAALCIQLRLLCNLLDGMVAVEGGKSSPSGELFNEIPDRISDPLILVAAGYAAHAGCGGVSLGWLAGLLAVLTAFVRTLASLIGAPPDFRGPMAKQHRMAVITGACLLSVIEPRLWDQGIFMILGLSAVVIGSIITLWLRAHAAYQYLEQKENV